jgi:carbon monoxide dehydrogenase subunit G
MEATYEGPDEGVGAMQKWRGDKMGNGMLKITESVADKELVYELEMEGGEYKMNGRIALLPSAAGTTVTWTAFGDAGGNPLAKYFSLMIDSFVGPDFERGLAKLKATAEANPM